MWCKKIESHSFFFDKHLILLFN